MAGKAGVGVRSESTLFVQLFSRVDAENMVALDEQPERFAEAWTTVAD